MRSPTPAMPRNVSGFAPRVTPSRVISASPRVMSAARAFGPNSRPSQAPVATAITFLKAPPICTPTGSALAYVRKVGAWSRGWSARAAWRSRAASTTSVGRPRATSRAKLGPDRKTTRSAATSGIVSASTSDMSLRLRSSMPLVATTTTACAAILADRPAVTRRRCCEGGTRSTTSARVTAAPASVGAEELRRDRPARRSDGRRRHHQNVRTRHPRLDRGAANGANERRHPLRRVPRIVLMHGLEVVGTEHDDHERQRRVDLDTLLDPYGSASAWLVRLLPCSTPPIPRILHAT